jgi:hypothetical protein
VLCKYSRPASRRADSCHLTESEAHSSEIQLLSITEQDVTSHTTPFLMVTPLRTPYLTKRVKYSGPSLTRTPVIRLP